MQKARDVHYIILMEDGTIIEDTKKNAKWTFAQFNAYWDRKAWHEKTSVRRSLFKSHAPISDFDRNLILGGTYNDN